MRRRSCAKVRRRARPKVPKKRPKALLILAAMGPGVVSAMAGNDAGGISTYSTAGANFGYGTLWVIPVMCILLLVVQTTAARMGAVTGKGFSALIRERFGIRLTTLAMCALLVGNVATTFSEFAGIASGMELFHVPTWVSVPCAALVVWLLVVKGSYKSVEKIFLAVSLVFVTYVVAAFLVGPDWGQVAHDTVVPHVPADPSFVSLVCAVDDVLHAEQRGGQGRHRRPRGNDAAEGGRLYRHHRRVPGGVVHHRVHGLGALSAGHRR